VLGTTSALGPYEGAFASPILGQNLETRAPFASALGGAGSWAAGIGGVLQGRFGFGSAATGYVLNAQTAANDILGVVVPLRSVNGANGGVIGGPSSLGGPIAALSWQFYDRTFRAWRIRQGIVVTLMPRGNFWLRFAAGAIYGQTVYASTADGSAISGAAAGAVQTPFAVVSNADPGCLARVSSSAYF
jgi:hypothetical protein